MLQVVICDDEQSALEKVKKELVRYREERKVHFKILEYNNAQALYYDITDSEPSDIFILDIEMPKKDGFNLADIIHQRCPNSEVVVLTNFPQYGVKAVNSDIRRYVTKDEMEAKLFPALDDVFRIVEKKRKGMYSRYWHNEKRLVEKERILYLQKDGKYCDFTVDGEEDFRERISINDAFEKLGAEEFIFIDRGIIANIPHIMSTENSMALMRNKQRLPISRSRLKDVRSAIHEYWSDRQ